MIPRRVRPKRSAGVKRKSRSAKDFKRIYGSKQRVEFVQSLPCAACGVVGFSENAHVAPASEKGTGYKAGFEWIVPMCRTHLRAKSSAWFDYQTGCHTMYDEYRRGFYKRFPDFNPEKAAAETEMAWQQFQENQGVPDSVLLLRQRIRSLIEEARSNAVVDFLKDKKFSIGENADD